MKFIGALGGSRTHNPQLRRLMLYPLSYECLPPAFYCVLRSPAMRDEGGSPLNYKSKTMAEGARLELASPFRRRFSRPVPYHSVHPSKLQYSFSRITFPPAAGLVCGIPKLYACFAGYILLGRDCRRKPLG